MNSPHDADERDELAELLEEKLQSPTFAAAYEDAQQRSRLVEELAEARKRTALSQRAIADEMGTTQSAISDFENAGTDPRLSTLQRYARAVGVRVHFDIIPEAPARGGLTFEGVSFERTTEFDFDFAHSAAWLASGAGKSVFRSAQLLPIPVGEGLAA